MKLPKPKTESEVSLQQAISKRHSVRDFADKALSLDQLSQILWAAKSIPSAGGLYPLEIYVVVKKDGVESLEAGVYYFNPKEHSLDQILKKDIHPTFSIACLDQEAVVQAPVSLVITAEYERTTVKYGPRGRRYVQIEVGHAGQNIYLQTTALGLGTVAIGAFDDEEVSRVLNLPSNHQPLYIMSIGWPR